MHKLNFQIMEFVRILKDYDHLWAVKQPDKEDDESLPIYLIDGIMPSIYLISL